MFHIRFILAQIRKIIFFYCPCAQLFGKQTQPEASVSHLRQALIPIRQKYETQ